MTENTNGNLEDELEAPTDLLLAYRRHLHIQIMDHGQGMDGFGHGGKGAKREM